MTRFLHWLLEKWTGEDYISSSYLLHYYEPNTDEGRAVAKAVHGGRSSVG